MYICLLVYLFGMHGEFKYIRPLVIRPSSIQNLDYPEPQLSGTMIEKDCSIRVFQVYVFNSI